MAADVRMHELIKTDAQRAFGGDADDGAWSVQETPDGGYVVSGFTDFLWGRGL